MCFTWSVWVSVLYTECRVGVLYMDPECKVGVLYMECMGKCALHGV